MMEYLTKVKIEQQNAKGVSVKQRKQGLKNSEKQNKVYTRN